MTKRTRILMFVPQSREIERSLNSIKAARAYMPPSHQVDLHFETGAAAAVDGLWDDVTRRYQIGRQMCLDGGYDAMFCVEDDQIIPPDALYKLIMTGADIAYGLCVTRRDPHLWAATIVCGPDDGDYMSYDMRPDAMRAAWGRTVDVIGCGLYCTLIQRHVLEAIPFERRGTRCCDFYAAYDWHKAGFTQKCDTTVLCGHVMDSGIAVWPDVKMRYRYDEAVAV